MLCIPSRNRALCIKPLYHPEHGCKWVKQNLPILNSFLQGVQNYIHLKLQEPCIRWILQPAHGNRSEQVEHGKELLMEQPLVINCIRLKVPQVLSMKPTLQPEPGNKLVRLIMPTPNS